MNPITPHRMLLFIAGENDSTADLMQAIGRILDEKFKDNYDLEVIDVLSHPERATEEQILITPTLILKLPKTERRLFGDLTDAERLHLILDLANGD